jgi:parvulin-like peptidyl-prolyl isomerase
MLPVRFVSQAAIAALIALSFLTACNQDQTAPSASPPGSDAATATFNPTVGAPPQGSTQYCQNGGQIVVKTGEALAARVNGQPIPLSVFTQQANQSQLALVQQGVDPNSDQGKEALKGLRAQVLSQLVDDALVEQAARQENINISPADIDSRVKQVIDDAGSPAKFQDYLKNNQLTVQDLCEQIRSNLFDEAMMARVTANLPGKVEQIHVAHILFAQRADADAALQKLKQGADFATLAKQLSQQDVATRDNGGDLGWFPHNVMPPEFEQAAFALKPGQISGVVSTQLGLHIIKLLERDPQRALTPELLQNQRLAAFNTWLDGLRSKAKIEKLVAE